MKLFTISLFALTTATSVVAQDGHCDGGQTVCSGLTSSVTVSTEFTHGGCRDIILLFTRGTLEPRNMVRSPASTDCNGMAWILTKIAKQGLVAGRELSRSLKDHYGAAKVATEGVEYPATEETNLLPGGGDPAGIAELTRLIHNATENCSGSKIVVCGYSQGAAITHRAVEALPSDVMSKLSAVVTFGDTR